MVGDIYSEVGSNFFPIFRLIKTAAHYETGNKTLFFVVMET